MAANMVRAALTSASPPSYEVLKKRLWAAAHHDAYILRHESDSLFDDDGYIHPEGQAFADVIQAVLKDYQQRGGKQ